MTLPHLKFLCLAVVETRITFNLWCSQYLRLCSVQWHNDWWV